jgi:hypothetical protein
MTSHPNTPPGTPGADGVPGALARIRHEIADLAQTLWAARGGDELMDTVAEAESLKSTLDALVLDVVRELEATNAVKPIGWASTQDYVTAVTGGHKGTGPAVVRLAKAVDTPLLAPVGEALKDGWLSVAKAQVITRVVDDLPGNPELRQRAVALLLDEAKRLDATDLRKAGRRIIETVDPDGQARREEQALSKEERAAHLHRDFWMTFDGAGGFRFGGHGSAEDGTKLRTTLMTLSKPTPAAGPTCDPATCEVPGCSHDGRDPRDHGARTFDALIDLCDRAAHAALLPECHGTTPRVSVTIDYEDLKSRTGHGTTDTGEDLSAETMRRMACDAEIIPMILGTDSQVLDVGRASRLVTAVIWLALVTRDRHCRFPNCTRPPIMCHAHHLIHWIEGGQTSLENLILLCGHHHRLIHAGPWDIRRTGPNEFTFDPPPGVRRMTTTGPEPPDG